MSRKMIEVKWDEGGHLSSSAGRLAQIWRSDDGLLFGYCPSFQRTGIIGDGYNARADAERAVEDVLGVITTPAPPEITPDMSPEAVRDALLRALPGWKAGDAYQHPPYAAVRTSVQQIAVTLSATLVAGDWWFEISQYDDTDCEATVLCGSLEYVLGVARAVAAPDDRTDTATDAEVK